MLAPLEALDAQGVPPTVAFGIVSCWRMVKHRPARNPACRLAFVRDLPSFRLALAAKDARLIEEAAQRHEVDVPLFSTIRRRLAEGAKEHGDEDFSATYWTSSPGRDGS